MPCVWFSLTVVVSVHLNPGAVDLAHLGGEDAHGVHDDAGIDGHHLEVVARVTLHLPLDALLAHRTINRLPVEPPVAPSRWLLVEVEPVCHGRVSRDHRSSWLGV